MPPLPSPVFSSIRTLGGVLSYPSERLHEEVAYIALHFHWPRDDILELEHAERQRWIDEINKINQKI